MLLPNLVTRHKEQEDDIEGFGPMVRSTDGRHSTLSLPDRFDWFSSTGIRPIIDPIG